MLPRHHQPVIAIATAAGRGAVGIIRASGQDLRPLIGELFGPLTLAPRLATYLPFRDRAGAVIDRGLAIHFPAPHSYTGEDVLELQAHGGPIVLQLLLARCLDAMPGLRLAEPGEFTERAFLNDKLDLAQAEAVADLIDASTEAAARSAGRSLSGAFSDEINRLGEQLLRLRMLVEATLDFPEEDIDFLQQADARGQLERIMVQLDRIRDRAQQGVLLREGISVVLAGQPNVGKSSLLNALAGAELAIVTPIAGTTRDKVGQTIQIDGVPVHVIDTAGLRADADARDEVERIGIQRSWGAIREADAVVFLRDLSRCGEPRYDADDQRIAALLDAEGIRGKQLLQVFNKTDLADAIPVDPSSLAVSTVTGDGLPSLRQRLLSMAGWHADTSGSEGVFIARARHVRALEQTSRHLVTARDEVHSESPALDLLAEELRLAHNALGEITGTVSVEALLGEIFSRFCIGK
jgi:tRNA modification GTPase